MGGPTGTNPDGNCMHSACMLQILCGEGEVQMRLACIFPDVWAVLQQGTHHVQLRHGSARSLPISSLAPGVCELPVIQQDIDACLCTLYRIDWVVIYKDIYT